MRLLKSLAANIATLTLALILASVIWGIAVRANDPVNQLPLRLPVEVVGRPADSSVSVSPDVVEIVAEGPASVLDGLTTNDFTAEVDLTGQGPGQAVVPIEIRHDVEGVQVAFQLPEEVTVQIEHIVSHEIPVRVEVRGDAARGYVLDEAFVDPATITVTGSASRVEPLSEARVTVFLDSPQQDAIVTRRPVFYDVQGNIASVSSLQLSAEEVVVTVPVDQLAGYAAKPIIVDWQGEPAPGYRLLDVRVEPDSVLLTGSPAQLEALSRVRTEPVDITGLRESVTLSVGLDLPQGLQLDDLQPIIVEIEIEPILTSSVISKRPEIRALGEGLTVTLDVDEVRVFLFGPLDKLDSLVDDDVRVTLDLFGLETGSHRLEPDAAVFVSDVEVRSIQPPELTVTITDVVTSTNDLSPTATPRSGLSFTPSSATTNGGLGALLLFLLAPATLVPVGLIFMRREGRA
ncbi:MAG TPA: CdaR family protein [Candidatus Binatia bacterium]|jgi:YbbR domain-containing protein|nr:CdaR family protein [Candidatus Binatia bacterium]